ncbi:MAG: sigma-54-dependent Fis family transcriptional regulator [Bacteroidales bacterium]|nr:sigma-54-dependent Fis family transcriptional regulator [Candidatus Cacconaster merdequi]
MELSKIKDRYGIIGNDPELDRALEVAVQVAGTDLSVLIAGESGVGKDVIPQIIHQNSPRKHGVYMPVNCGAIPEGTIDSELFGHEKGSFTGATEARRGYFEEADGGTLFLDEVAELPLSTQVRLLRVLQTGEFIKVGSSKIQKTNVRVIAATNVNLRNAISQGKFREDLYYRLNTVPINMPSLRERKGDIYLLFRKFALDFADKYKMPAIRLDEEARQLLESYRWPGNIRQLKSVAEQISILEHDRQIPAEVLAGYLPSDPVSSLPVKSSEAGADYLSDRDIIFKILFQLRKDVDELKEAVAGGGYAPKSHSPLLISSGDVQVHDSEVPYVTDTTAYEEQPAVERSSLSIQEVSADFIKKALEKHNGKRKAAAAELGISERTLYRKLKELGI